MYSRAGAILGTDYDAFREDLKTPDWPFASTASREPASGHGAGPRTESQDTPFDTAKPAAEALMERERPDQWSMSTGFGFEVTTFGGKPGSLTVRWY